MTAALDRMVDMAVALERADEPLPHIVEDFAVRGFVTELVGRHSSWKSWLMLMLARRAHCGGGDVGGLSCKSARSLYVDAENGPRLIARRFRVADIASDGLLVMNGFGLHLPGAIGELRRYIEAADAEFVILDSQRRLAPGAREDKSDDMAPLLGALAKLTRALDIALVIIHHRSAKPGAPDSRGSSAIEDQVDAMFALEHVAGDPRRLRRRLRTIKYRMDAEPPSRWLEFGHEAARITVAAAEAYEHATPAESIEAPPAHEHLAVRLRLLAEAVYRDGGWAPLRLATAVGKDADDGTFKRALSLLVETGEWLAEGSTRARRYRPAHSGHSGQPLRDDQNGQNQIALPDGSENGHRDPDHGGFTPAERQGR